MGHLCSAWLQVSEDTSVGTGQKVDVFWRRVCDTLAARLQTDGLPALDKEWNHAQAKFGSMSRDVSLFAAKYQQVINLNESVKTDADHLLDAQRLFHHSSHPDPIRWSGFRYMNCYTCLKDSPNWVTQRSVGEGAQKR